MTKLDRVFLEPVNSLTHLAGAIAALGGTTILLWRAPDEVGKSISLLIYGLCLTALFLASALLHSVRGPDSLRMWLNRVDHAAIFFLIAGTYTPIIFNLFPDPWRTLPLVIIWTAALIGAAYKLTSRRIHGVVNASIYLALGWGGVVPLLLMIGLASMAPLAGSQWLLLGGIIYSLGFVVYYFRRPDPWPSIFGHHEIWHLFVLAGGLCHYLFMLWYVAPGPS